MVINLLNVKNQLVRRFPMKIRLFCVHSSIFIFLFIVVIFSVAFAQRPAENTEVNLALVAKTSTSYVSGDTTLEALNNGDTPSRSLNSPGNAYGNWNRTGTQWVQYNWDRPISTSKIDVYWWDDNQGVRAPLRRCRVLRLLWLLASMAQSSP